MRSYGDLVEVRGEGPGAGPEQFVWRGRLYLVREVLSHWYERTAWWDGAAARAARGASDAGGAASTIGGEREMWRVHASPGRSTVPGVFDLALSAGADTDTPSWHLVRVAD